MDDIVPSAPLARMVAQGIFQTVLIVIIEFDEMYTFILQEITVSRRADGSPGVITPLERLLDEETTNETTRAGNQNTFFHSLAS